MIILFKLYEKINDSLGIDFLREFYDGDKIKDDIKIKDIKDFVEKNKNNITDIDYQQYTLLSILASASNISEHLDIMFIMIESNINWNIKTEWKKTFLDMLDDENKKIIIDKYDLKYIEYLNNKKINEFNI